MQNEQRHQEKAENAAQQMPPAQPAAAPAAQASEMAQPPVVEFTAPQFTPMDMSMMLLSYLPEAELQHEIDERTLAQQELASLIPLDASLSPVPGLTPVTVIWMITALQTSTP